MNDSEANDPTTDERPVVDDTAVNFEFDYALMNGTWKLIFRNACPVKYISGDGVKPVPFRILIVVVLAAEAR